MEVAWASFVCSTAHSIHGEKRMEQHKPFKDLVWVGALVFFIQQFHCINFLMIILLNGRSICLAPEDAHPDSLKQVYSNIVVCQCLKWVKAFHWKHSPARKSSLRSPRGVFSFKWDSWLSEQQQKPQFHRQTFGRDLHLFVQKTRPYDHDYLMGYAHDCSVICSVGSAWSTMTIRALKWETSIMTPQSSEFLHKQTPSEQTIFI